MGRVNLDWKVSIIFGRQVANYYGLHKSCKLLLYNSTPHLTIGAVEYTTLDQSQQDSRHAGKRLRLGKGRGASLLSEETTTYLATCCKATKMLFRDS